MPVLRHIRRRTAGNAAALSLVLASCAAAAAPPLPASYMDQLRRAEGEPVNLQALGTVRSFVGDYAGAMAAFDQVQRKTPGGDDPRNAGKLDGAVAKDAIEAIVEQARGKRVVLLNEAHHVPMHRAFAMRLASELRKIGYTYLACEAFSNDATGTGPGPVVTMADGYYLRDPVFAQFIRSAVADNWKLVPYESPSDPAQLPAERIKAREMGQARNLVEKIFARDKDAKVFVYVGYGHLLKTPAGQEGGMVMMGEYLRRLTGLDTLHVEQQRFFAHPDPADNSATYNAIQARFPQSAPYVLKSAAGKDILFNGMEGRADMQVVFPAYGADAASGRPAWLQTLALRHAQPIPAGLLPATGRRLIQAHFEADPADAVPADVVLVEAGKPVPSFMLPPGKFRYSFQD
ncbi:hypothetical protein [Massilia sp. Root418]|uniref:hypothetical protein n=1 Tax=Massilia sp. Root418 TaxID=1736532 RepID=UPI000AAFB499|nr:hypothetical protein [Massilia sp. Root418]